MQVNVTVECSPQEARAFLGLPDLAPLHAIYLDKMKSLTLEGVQPADMERMYKAWGTGLSESLEQFQRLFWTAASGPSAGR